MAVAVALFVGVAVAGFVGVAVAGFVGVAVGAFVGVAVGVEVFVGVGAVPLHPTSASRLLSRVVVSCVPLQKTWIELPLESVVFVVLAKATTTPSAASTAKVITPGSRFRFIARGPRRG